MSEMTEFAGMPEESVYCWVWGKAPKYDRWNAPKNLFSLEQIKANSHPDWHQNSSAPTGFGMVSGRWSGTVAVDFDNQPDNPEQAESTFRITTGHPSADLPPSATIISGRPHRRRIFFKVPEVWWPCLSGYSAKLLDLELRWEGGDHNAPVPIQSVMRGDHPGHPDWHFRWAEGLSPADVGWAEAPTWLLIAMVKQRGVEVGLETEEKISGPTVDSPGYCDQLNPYRTRKILRLFSEHWPYRGGETGSRYQASWNADSFAGLMGALNNVCGAKIAEDWLHDTEWFKKNQDWGCDTDFSNALRSVGKSKTGRKAGWGTLHHLASRTADISGNQFPEPAVKLPSWALPPKEVDVSSLSSETVKKVKEFRATMKLIDEMESPLDRLAAFQNLGKALEVNERELKALLERMQEEDSVMKGGEFMTSLLQSQETKVAVEKLLAFNCLTLVGAEGGVGKSTLLYRLAEAASNGSKFLGQLEVEQGNVLIVQKDESVANIKAKNSLMNLQMRPDSVFIEYSFHQGMFPDLRRWIREREAKYVLMDSMVSLFGGGSDMNESEIGTYMYLLNQLASEEGVAIVLTHHLRKAMNGRSRDDIHLSDLYGSAFIGAGTSDVWGLIRDPEKKAEDEPSYILKVLKPRSGVTDSGDTFRLEGSRENLSYHLTSINSDEKGINELRLGSKKMYEYLQSRTEETAVDGTVIASYLGLTEKSVRRMVLDLWKNRRLGVKRKEAVSTSGRPRFLYWV